MAHPLNRGTYTEGNEAAFPVQNKRISMAMQDNWLKDFRAGKFFYSRSGLTANILIARLIKEKEPFVLEHELVGELSGFVVRKPA